MILSVKIRPIHVIGELTRSYAATENGLDNSPGETELAALKRLAVDVLEPLRECLGAPIIVTSGFRNPAVNRLVGGVAASQHTKGEAADCYTPLGARHLLDVLLENKLSFPHSFFLLCIAENVGQERRQFGQLAPDHPPVDPANGRPRKPCRLANSGCRTAWTAACRRLHRQERTGDGDRPVPPRHAVRFRFVRQFATIGLRLSTTGRTIVRQLRTRREDKRKEWGTAFFMGDSFGRCRLFGRAVTV
ncbi:hypothetical protein H8S65_11960 [Parabacteroides sp. N37]|uniref:Peptidase M15A C-terminal domain-containing protein n=1 Tax=Parabacteroides hominis TaxID=2763057 RepID=A0ABR7DPV9_9BACT|nr:hypothetical protein [Parabacteroides hominis]